MEASATRLRAIRGIALRQGERQIRVSNAILTNIQRVPRPQNVKSARKRRGLKQWSLRRGSISVFLKHARRVGITIIRVLMDHSLVQKPLIAIPRSISSGRIY